MYQHGPKCLPGPIRGNTGWWQELGKIPDSAPGAGAPDSPAAPKKKRPKSRPRPKRYTDQQRDMVQYIFSRHNHFDAEQLIDALKHEGFRVSRATVYRTLDKLVDAGLLRRLDVSSRTFYEHDYGYPQHEHLY